jgi:lipoprotein-anchoring transpeptidase ErfK/SrfK
MTTGRHIFHLSGHSTFVVVLFVCLLAACQTTPESAPHANTNVVSPTPTPERVAVKLPVTLPVLDALLFEESFAEEVKVKVGLTDDEIAKLRTASSEAVMSLGRGQRRPGSTAAAVKRAEEKIRSILGDDKADLLFEVVRNRFALGDLDADTALPTQPNNIPDDTRIVVNAPAYRMDVFQDGVLVKTYRIGIGYPEFPIPNTMRKAQSIIFNPTWTPPDEPWVRGKLRPGVKVEAGSPDNPLGPIKIPIGMPSLIHGGKQPWKLGTFASHGCVGLTNKQVHDFARLLAQVSGTKLTPQDLKKFEREKTETKNVPLQQPVPVELRYETIVVENGKLMIYRDVYDHGTNTVDSLRKVLAVYDVSFDNLSERDRQRMLAAFRSVNTRGLGKIEIALPELAGKGYPAPVDLNTGK